MILVDTHIWIWWASGDERLPKVNREALENSADGVAVSIGSCWEIAKKVEKEARKAPESRTLVLRMPIKVWIEAALLLHGLLLIPLSPAIVLDSAPLPGDYNLTNTDPFDQLVIATARVENIPLMTVDHKITPYPHVQIWQ